MEMRDYVAWHDDYDRPGSRLHLRLLVVQDLIAAALDERPPGAIRVIRTRVPRDDGILHSIQDWFIHVGFEPRALVVGEGELFGVGAAQFHGRPMQAPAGVRLFDFFR